MKPAAPPQAPALPTAAVVWQEAHAALLDQLERQDAAHALQRLARSLTHLTGMPCRIEAGVGALPAPMFTAGDFDPTQPLWRLGLRQSGVDVGVLALQAPPGLQRPEWARGLQPLLTTAGALLAALLERRGDVPLGELALARAAMREGGSFVWAWDIPADTLGDIDEGAEMLGYPPGEIGHTQADWNRLIHPDDAQGVEDAYQAHVRGETAHYRAIYRARAADGRWHWLEERGRIIERDAAGHPLRMVGTQTDATVQMALQQARQDQLAAEAANAAKTQFLSRVSHELRTPLNAVLGFAQLMEMEPPGRLDEAQRRRVTLIRQAGDYLLAMIGDLLDLSLIESGRLPVQPEVLDLSPLAHDAVDLVRAQADAAGVHLGQPRLDAGFCVHADPMRLKQVLINLLTNAIKYNRPGGSVGLWVRHDAEQRCVIEVSDTGPGIPPERMAELFQPFNRLGRESSGVPGSGLGLALSRALVQAMHGELTASSPQGQGCVFRVALPCVTAPGAVAEP